MPGLWVRASPGASYFWIFSLKEIKMFPPDRESNPGLPRDRRRSSPLDYRGLCTTAANSYVRTEQEAICVCIIGYLHKKETNPSSRIWTSDLWISDANNYSPPLYQLSYRRWCCKALHFTGSHFLLCPTIRCCCSSQGYILVCVQLPVVVVVPTCWCFQLYFLRSESPFYETTCCCCSHWV